MQMFSCAISENIHIFNCSVGYGFNYLKNCAIEFSF